MVLMSHVDMGNVIIQKKFKIFLIKFYEINLKPVSVLPENFDLVSYQNSEKQDT